MAFPEPHIRLPKGPHSHTAILLHGRGSNGPEFADEFFSSKTSATLTLEEHLVDWRWVFPTSCNRWNARFQEDMCAWFDTYSLEDVHEQQDQQVAGLRESVSHVLNILEREIDLLGGKTDHVYLGGISQGMATALWTLFGATGQSKIREPLGGFLGFCGWFPFANKIEELLKKQTAKDPPSLETQRRVCGFVVDTLAGGKGAELETLDLRILSTPFFLSHGSDDVWVPVKHGREASRVLELVVPRVQWREFMGAEGDGHWIKEPEGFDQILEYLGSNAVRYEETQ